MLQVTKSILDTSSTTTGGGDGGDGAAAAKAGDKSDKSKKGRRAKRAAKEEEEETEMRAGEVALSIEVPPLRPQAGGVRVRLAEDADRVEVEFIDEKMPATHC